MTNHEYELLTQAVTVLGDILRQNNAGAAIIADKLDELEQIIEKTEPERPRGIVDKPQPTRFHIGQKVVAWRTGERLVVLKRHPVDVGLYRCGTDKDKDTWAFWYCAETLLPIPPAPPSTNEYDVREYKVPVKGEDEGWIDVGGDMSAGVILLNWFDGCHWLNKNIDHGYRWTISRVPKAKFAEGAPELPDTPPDYKGPGGPIKMQWVRDAEGKVVWRDEIRDENEYWWGYNSGVVFKGPPGTNRPICKPIAIVVGRADNRLSDPGGEQ